MGFYGDYGNYVNLDYSDQGFSDEALVGAPYYSDFYSKTYHCSSCGCWICSSCDLGDVAPDVLDCPHCHSVDTLVAVH